jgi:hypothetical protein
MLLHRGLAILAAAVGSVAITACVSKHEMSDDEWCKSFEYRPGMQDYTECRQRIDRQRQRSVTLIRNVMDATTRSGMIKVDGPGNTLG